MNALILALAMAAGLTDPPDSTGTRADATPAWKRQIDADGLPRHTNLVQSELWATRDEAANDAMDRAATAAREFVGQVDSRAIAAWDIPAWLVHDHLLREPPYVEEVDWTYGPMYRAHVLLDFSPEKRELLLSHWRESLTSRRLGQVGAGLGFAVLCLATLLGYLRLDDATKGYYTAWLRTGAVAVVGGSAAALYHWVV
jgi:hypothetical protein